MLVLDSGKRRRQRCRELVQQRQFDVVDGSLAFHLVDHKLAVPDDSERDCGVARISVVANETKAVDNPVILSAITRRVSKRTLTLLSLRGRKACYCPKATDSRIGRDATIKVERYARRKEGRPSLVLTAWSGTCSKRTLIFWALVLAGHERTGCSVRLL